MLLLQPCTLMEDKIRFYCPIKVPARGRVITVIYITQKNNKHSNT
jgi:hypothetical protein